MHHNNDNQQKPSSSEWLQNIFKGENYMKLNLPNMSVQVLTHCGLVMYTIWWYRFRSTLAQVIAYHQQHQAITWTNADLSPKVFCGAHLCPISQEALTNLFRYRSNDLKTHFKL